MDASDRIDEEKGGEERRLIPNLRLGKTAEPKVVPE
jgi:hypothetical protein